MHRIELRLQALDLLSEGVPRLVVSRLLGVSPQSTMRWEHRIEPRVHIRCPRCLGETIDPTRYGYLLGQYLGDGHIAPVGRSVALRIYCTTRYPDILTEVADAMAALTGASVNRRMQQGCTQVQSTTRHWLCLFPQHGPGRKHLRRIVLVPWQRDLVASNPRGLVRGLLHADGCRVSNSVHRQVAGTTKTYSYPRYFFSNLSEDIIGILTDALDLLGIAWRRNRFNSVSIARREAVAALDEFVGPKT